MNMATETIPPPRKTLNASMMARRLRVPRRWLIDEARAGRVPALNVGRDFLFNPEVVELVLATRAAQQQPEASRD